MYRPFRIPSLKQLRPLLHQCFTLSVCDYARVFQALTVWLRQILLIVQYFVLKIPFFGMCQPAVSCWSAVDGNSNTVIFFYSKKHSGKYPLHCITEVTETLHYLISRTLRTRWQTVYFLPKSLQLGLLKEFISSWSVDTWGLQQPITLSVHWHVL